MTDFTALIQLILTTSLDFSRLKIEMTWYRIEVHPENRTKTVCKFLRSPSRFQRLFVTTVLYDFQSLTNPKVAFLLFFETFHIFFKTFSISWRASFKFDTAHLSHLRYATFNLFFRNLFLKKFGWWIKPKASFFSGFFKLGYCPVIGYLERGARLARFLPIYVLLESTFFKNIRSQIETKVFCLTDFAGRWT